MLLLLVFNDINYLCLGIMISLGQSNSFMLGNVSGVPDPEPSL